MAYAYGAPFTLLRPDADAGSKAYASCIVLP